MTVKKKGRDYNISLLTHHIVNWRNDVVGVFFHAQELSYLYRVFDALRVLLAANGTEQVINNTVKATEILGHPWGRLYQLSADDQPALVSKASYGTPDLGSVFDSGEVTLPPQNDAASSEAWLCIAMRRPIVFCHFKGKPDREVLVTPRGLEAINIQDPKCPPLVAKKEGEFWIDFPLLGEDRPLGKLTLHCHSRRYNPEDWEFLRVLCTLTSELLQASLAWEKENEKKAIWMRQSAEWAIEDVCHHIGTTLATFDALVSRYRQVAGSNTALQELNQRLEETHRLLSRKIVNTRERLTRYVAETKQEDMVTVIRRVFTGPNKELDWSLTGETRSLLMDVDAPRFESALLELIHNARQCSPNPTGLRLDIALRILPDRDRVLLEFRDNGPGVPEDYKERIFERFFSRRPRGEPSTGQGLYFVRRVVEAHGGTIREIGKPGEGAHFVLQLPRYNHSQVRPGLDSGLPSRHCSSRDSSGSAPDGPGGDEAGGEDAGDPDR
jgi:hypothetical protein